MQKLIDANKLTADAKFIRDDGVTVYFPAILVTQIFNTEPILTIPDNPTNGDMIQAMFPNAECWEDKIDYVMNVDFGNNIIQRFDLGWWNAPWKRGGTNT